MRSRSVLECSLSLRWLDRVDTDRDTFPVHTHARARTHAHTHTHHSGNHRSAKGHATGRDGWGAGARPLSSLSVPSLSARALLRVSAHAMPPPLLRLCCQCLAARLACLRSRPLALSRARSSARELHPTAHDAGRWRVAVPAYLCYCTIDDLNRHSEWLFSKRWPTFPLESSFKELANHNDRL